MAKLLAYWQMSHYHFRQTGVLDRCTRPVYWTGVLDRCTSTPVETWPPDRQHLYSTGVLDIAQWDCTVGLHSGIAQWDCTIGLHNGIAQLDCTVGLHNGIYSGIAQWDCTMGLHSGIAQWDYKYFILKVKHFYVDIVAPQLDIVFYQVFFPSFSTKCVILAIPQYSQKCLVFKT